MAGRGPSPEPQTDSQSNSLLFLQSCAKSMLEDMVEDMVEDMEIVNVNADTCKKDARGHG